MNTFLDFTFWLRLLGGLAAGAALVVALTAVSAGTMRSAAVRRSWWQASFVALALVLGAELTGVGRSFLAGGVETASRDRHVIARGNLPVTIDVGPESLPPVAAPGTAMKSAQSPAAACWWPGWIWLAGSAFLLARFGFARVLLLAFAWRQQPVSDLALLERVDAIRRQLGISSRLQLRTLNCLRSPVAFGLLKRGIGLPAGFGEAFSPAQQDAMLAHEAAHLAARDPLWHGFAEIVTAALWWHPLVWWARRQLHVASEFAADEASLVVDRGPAVLAESLVAMGRQLQQRPALGWLGVEGNYRSVLGRRVARLLQLEGATWRPASRTARWAAFGGAVVVAALTVAASAWAMTNNAAEPSLAGLVQEALAGSNSSPASSETTRPSPASEASKLVQDGELLYEMGRLDEAEQKLKLALQQDPKNARALYYLKLVDQVRSARATVIPAPVSGVASNQVRATTDRRRIVSKLNSIQVDSLSLDGMELGEATAKLSALSKQQDPEKTGVNFLIVNTTTNATETQHVLLNGAVVKKNIRLVDALDVIVRSANRPIKYSILDYGVAFSEEGPTEPTPLFTRMFKVDPNTFIQGLEREVPQAFMEDGVAVKATNVTARLGRAIQELFSKQGVDFAAGNGKSIFFKDRQGALLVRASLQDLDVIESVIASLNTAPPQVNIKAKFVEITREDGQALIYDWYLGNFATNAQDLPGGVWDWAARQLTNAHNIRVTTTLRTNLMGILSEAQARVVFRALEQRSDVDVLSAPEVTTMSGRQARVSITETHRVVISSDPQASETIESGPILDIVPTVLADGFTVQLTVAASVTEFLDYEPTVTSDKAAVPTPRFRHQQIKTQALVWDGQTVLLGGMSQATGTNAKPSAVRKLLLVFITPTIIGPAGNRVHTDEDMPFARDGVPPQQTSPPARPGSTPATPPSAVFPGAFPSQPVKTGSAR